MLWHGHRIKIFVFSRPTQKLTFAVGPSLASASCSETRRFRVILVRWPCGALAAFALGLGFFFVLPTDALGRLTSATRAVVAWPGQKAGS